MSTVHAPAPQARSTRTDTGVRWDRVVLGLLVAAVGIGWLAEELGASVPWSLLPAVGLVLVGVALLVSLTGGRGRSGLVVLGVVLLGVAISVGVGAERFAGPVGDRVVAPVTEVWPAPTRVAAGTVTVDLTRGPLPAAGRLDVAVGAGRVVVRLPDDRPVRVEARVVLGTVRVDGEAVRQGVDLQWIDPATARAPVAVVVDVGAGDVEVFHGDR